jgi:superfamily II DNA/RNA helicase
MDAAPRLIDRNSLSSPSYGRSERSRDDRGPRAERGGQGNGNWRDQRPGTPSRGGSASRDGNGSARGERRGEFDNAGNGSRHAPRSSQSNGSGARNGNAPAMQRPPRDRHGDGGQQRDKMASAGQSRGNRRSKAKDERLELDIISFIRDNPVIHELAEDYESEHLFSDFGLRRDLLRNVTQRGYEMPTPIQDKSIPVLMEGRDIVGLANTGTGKTAAFLLPLINRMLDNPRERAIILAPTRELAIQIDEELQNFTRGMPIRSTVIVGGVGMGPQIASFRRFNNFVIGTPGRIIDLIRRGSLQLNDVKNVVLDEADRMLDMGFINDMRFIMTRLPSERQTMFFSATMGDDVRGLIGEFLHNPVTVTVARQRVAANVEQEVMRLSGRNRVDVLEELLGSSEFSRVLVFGRTKHGMNKLSNMLNARGLNTDAIHGNKSHNARQLALKRFKSGQVQALIATDVAARGLDIEDVTHVINFELPQTYEDYIHRIGRTGRAGKAGNALTFVD